jgi:serine/threonine-protein kinase
MARPVDWRIDIFAVGVLLYRMTSGRGPFNDVAEWLREGCPLQPVGPLADIIARAMAREPSERFPTAAAMATALRERCLLSKDVAPALARRVAERMDEERPMSPLDRLIIAGLANASLAPSPQHRTAPVGLPIVGASADAPRGPRDTDVMPARNFFADVEPTDIRTFVEGAPDAAAGDGSFAAAEATHPLAQPLSHATTGPVIPLALSIELPSSPLLPLLPLGQDSSRLSGMDTQPHFVGKSQRRRSLSLTVALAAATLIMALVIAVPLVRHRADGAEASPATPSVALVKAPVPAELDAPAPRPTLPRQSAQMEFTPTLVSHSTAAASQREAAPHRARRAPAPEHVSGPSGYLTLDTQPWGTVYLDGKRIGVTPFARAVVPAGRHKLAIDVEDSGRRKLLPVQVAADSETRLNLQLR